MQRHGVGGSLGDPIGPPVAGGVGAVVAVIDPEGEPVVLNQASVGRFGLSRGGKRYELKNHLGNVLSVVTDLKLGQGQLNVAPAVVDFYLPQVVEVSDYFPFGWQLPGRNWRSGARYRYAFQGQEGDDAWSGEEVSVFFKYRVHDARIGRFLSVDPLAAEYAGNSVYAFAENKVIRYVELEGLETGDNYDPSGYAKTGIKVYHSTDAGSAIVETGILAVFTAGSIFAPELVPLIEGAAVSVVGNPLVAAQAAIGLTEFGIGLFDPTPGGLDLPGPLDNNGRVVRQAFNNLVEAAPSAVSKTEGILPAIGDVGGGAYKKVENLRDDLGKVTTEKNHIPSMGSIKDAGFVVSPGNMTVVRKMFADHRKYISTGTSRAAALFRAKETELLRNGQFDEAFDLNVEAMRSQFGNRYDKYIEQAREQFKQETIPFLRNQLNKE